MTIPKPISPPAQALLQRLDEGYAPIDPDAPETDPPAWWGFWTALLSEDEMTTDDHIAGLIRRIAKQTQEARRCDARAAAVEGTGPKAEQERQAFEYSAASCRADVAKHQALLDALRDQEAA
jgi:hypothetical protein